MGCWRKVYAKPLKSKTPVKAAKKRIKPQSDKLKSELSIYSKERKAFLLKHEECEAKISNCTFVASEVHHKAGREGKLLLDKSKWLAICHNCHVYITENSREAIELGLSLSRLGKALPK